MKTIRTLVCAALVLAGETGAVLADEIRVAVASNFSDAIKAAVDVFEKESGHRVILIFGSTGKHYAQIRNGAPFEAFFAADARRPELLEAQGVAEPGSRFTYAVGKVVLWSPDPDLIDAGADVLVEGGFRHLAMANPKLAPYGKATEEVMRKKGVWDNLRTRTVRGENIAQTFQFVKSGNAELGFVALSQITKPGKAIAGSLWRPPQALYTPIEQQAVLLEDNPAARQFLAFMQEDAAVKIIQSHGYDVPDQP
ncbi:MAG: molybdate ABC transporter substrate-binding protein [Xanthomonadaceae bacterium]|nr:molybdate ABC transporter substrate-binding protein [Xanthomonadaceae bacterium]